MLGKFIWIIFYLNQILSHCQINHIEYRNPITQLYYITPVHYNYEINRMFYKVKRGIDK